MTAKSYQQRVFEVLFYNAANISAVSATNQLQTISALNIIANLSLIFTEITNSYIPATHQTANDRFLYAKGVIPQISLKTRLNVCWL